MSVEEQQASQAISVSLITGFLGSGKTTLLNYLLQHPEIEETAVLINEFGEIGLDHLLVKEIDDDVILLSSGCICCTVQGELVDSLRSLYMRKITGEVPDFTRLVIETTGLADPGPIITCLMDNPLFKHAFRLDSLVTTVDGVHGMGHLDDHEEAVKQAAVADRIIITKSDLADADDIKVLHERLHQLNPGAIIFEADFCRVSPNELFNAGLFDPKSKSVNVQHWLNSAAYNSDDSGHDHGHDHGQVDVNRHDEHISSFCLTADEPLDWNSLIQWYDDLANERGDHLLRVKGLVNVAGKDAPYALQCVQAIRHTPAKLPAWPDDDHRTRIVFITRDLSKDEVEESFQACLVESTKRIAGRDSAKVATATNGGRSSAGAKGPSMRGRWLNDAELSRLFAVLAENPDRRKANAARLMLLTGALSHETLEAAWVQFDLERKIWMRPSPNSRLGKPRRVRLSGPALSLLKLMRQENPEGIFLFPGNSPGEPLKDMDSFWDSVTSEAKLEGARLEDLRPILASHIFDGLEQPLVDRFLGLAEEALQ